MQIAFSIVYGSPALVAERDVEGLADLGRGSRHPSVSELAMRRGPIRRRRNAFFQLCMGPVCPYGTTISLTDARCRIGRSGPQSS